MDIFFISLLRITTQSFMLLLLRPGFSFERTDRYFASVISQEGFIKRDSLLLCEYIHHYFFKKLMLKCLCIHFLIFKYSYMYIFIFLKQWFSMRVPVVKQVKASMKRYCFVISSACATVSASVCIRVFTLSYTWCVWEGFLWWKYRSRDIDGLTGFEHLNMKYVFFGIFSLWTHVRVQYMYIVYRWLYVCAPR
jgi:hypothetical protein